LNGLDSYDVDPNDGITLYDWDFGDNSPHSSDPLPTHIYQSTGSYTVTLRVTDHYGATQLDTWGITITSAPASPPAYTQVQGNAAQFISQSVPTTMYSGSSYPVSLTMRNVGTTTWTAAQLYRLGDPRDAQTPWGIQRVAAPANIAPGQFVTFNFIVVAPTNAALTGTLIDFQWNMVQDGVQWFSPSSLTPDVQVMVYGNSTDASYAPTNLSMARLDAVNRTGAEGEDLFSGNFNWHLPILNLAGRAGLNLGLALTYNSLVWTKVGSAITYDADRGFPGPGFRLGFPSIQGPFYNDQAALNSYLLILPSGAHVELRDAGNGIYQATNSSNLQLETSSNQNGLRLRSADGTEMAYWSINNENRCTGIKDRNGNYLTIKYDPVNGVSNTGRLTSIVDTLNRTINFTYDANFRLQTITQSWNGGTTHTWATFGYTDLTLQTDFRNQAGRPLRVLGPWRVENSTSTVPPLSVLTQIGLDDGTHYNFAYTSWGQVWTIYRFADAGTTHQLAYLRYNLPVSNSAPQTDCPRFTQRLTQANDWNGSSPAVTNYQFALGGAMGRMNAPDGTIYKESYGTSGWQRGLAVRTDTYSSEDLNTPKRTTTTAWTQDNTTLSYPLNPRAAEIIVRDAGKRRKTSLEYTSYGLLSDAIEWEPDGTDGSGNERWLIIRRIHTDYNLSEAYLSRYIIGLPQAQYTYARNVAPTYMSQVLMSKTTYDYDSGSNYLLDQGNPVQHDAAFNSSLLARGNLTGTRRRDVNDENNQVSSLASTIGYNTAGDAVFTRDPMWQDGQSGHQTTLSYTDSGAGGGNTLAYPTMVTDADGFSSALQYRYDIGALTYKQTPRPQGADQDPIETYDYDGAGRLIKATALSSGANTQWVYPVSQTIVISKTTINDLSNPAYSFRVLDGAGHVRAMAADHPGSMGHYSGQYITYDQMGRVIRQYNPIEIDGDWIAAGDDAVDSQTGSGGWRFSSQSYDWKGRPTLTVNVDQTTRQISYDGCGCAGSDVVTVTDEVGRREKVSYDALGRAVSSQTFNMDTSATVYSTTTHTYNALDQVIKTKQYKGAETSSVFQETTMQYDGYGRFFKLHLPEQTDSSNQQVFTTYDYNRNDTVHMVTDGRGATTTFTYNGRRQVTGVTHTLAGNSFNVSYDYDVAGNRTVMTDPQGTTSYCYNALSHLTAESRYINALGRAYTLNYTYTIGGQLESLTDSSNVKVSYTYDATAKLTKITDSSGYANGTDYVTNIAYRAWGAVKSARFGNNTSETITYTPRLQPWQFRLLNGNGSSRLREDYSYYADGRLQKITDLDDTPGTSSPTTLRFMSRSYDYDQAGQVINSRPASGAPTPYSQTYTYNEFDNMTSRTGTYGFQSNQSGDSATFTNNRRDGWVYDQDGRLSISPANSSSNARTWSYNAAGQLTGTTETGGGTTTTYTSAYDGDGQTVYEAVTGGTSPNTDYLVHSTVLGGEVITKLDASGNKSITYVQAGGLIFPRQSVSNGQQTMDWSQRNPLGVTEVDAGGNLSAYDPLGNYVPLKRFSLTPPSPMVGLSGPSYSNAGAAFGNANNYSTGCTLDGAPTDCNTVLRAINSGQAGGTISTTGTMASLFTADLGGLAGGLYQGYVSNDGRYRLVGSANLRNRGGGEYYGIFKLNGSLLDVSWKGATFFVPGSMNGSLAGNDSGGIQSPQKTAVSPEELKAYHDRVAGMLNDSCNKFLKGLLNEAKAITGRSYRGVLETFDQIKFYWEDTRPNGGYAYFEHALPAASIDNTIKTEPFIGQDRTAFLISQTTQAFLGETLHHMGEDGDYIDGVMAQALNNILVKKGLDKPQTFDLRGVNAAEVQRASTYWHPKVWTACPASRR
jgi:YD repeat-containing protein